MTIMVCDERIFEDSGASNRLRSVVDKNEEQLRREEEERKK